MKTMNNNRESESNTVNSFFAKGSAIVCGLALITLTVNAQTLWEKYSNYTMDNKMEMASSAVPNQHSVAYPVDMEITSEASTAQTSFALELEADAELNIEEWMTEEANFAAKVNFGLTDTEEELSIENWMLETKNFESFSLQTTLDYEQPLEIEPWMTEEENFSPVEYQNEAEPELQIESWMIQNNNFENNATGIEYMENESLKMEAWMTSEQIWGF